MIKIYTVPKCKKCKEVKKYLLENSIDYEEIDLAAKENREARAFYRSLGIQTAPVIVGENSGGEWIITEFNEKKFKELNYGKR